MDYRKLLCLVMTILMLLLTGCASTPPDVRESDTSTEPSAEPPADSSETLESSESSTQQPEETMKKTYSILFIGNSYTYYNDMPTALFEKMATAAGYSVEVTAITKGAHTLAKFADPTDEYGAKVEAALNSDTRYDYVILQEQSVLPATNDPAEFYRAVRNLYDRIRLNRAKPILYSTWGRKTGNSTLSTNGWTNESMTWRLAAAYGAIGDETRTSVAHVGLAFYDVYTSQSKIDLYDADYTHPSYAGSYLAAATLFAKIFDVDPTTLTFTGELSGEQAAILLEAARKAVFETPAIPEEYQTSSKGIGERN